MSRAENLRKTAILPNPSSRHKPRGYGTYTMEPDQRQFVLEQSLGIFADMTNAGFTFQEALSAIFMTGMHYAVSALNPKQQEK